MKFLAVPPTPAGTSALRVQLCYLWRHRRLARLREPRLLTEWIQHRKLHDRDPRLPMLADKVRAKREVARLLGPSWVIPTLWQGRRLPRQPAWPFPYVVKSRHGSQQVMVVRSRACHAVAIARSEAWMARDYGGWLDEWLYGEIPRGLLVEPFVGHNQDLPIDYKMFVFGGEVRFVQVHLQRATNHRWVVMDLDWNRVSSPDGWPDPEPPTRLVEMIHAATRLGRDLPFVRADFYEVHGRPLFGELTFYPGSGLEKVEPPALNREMGELWAEAMPQRRRQAA